MIDKCHRCEGSGRIIEQKVTEDSFMDGSIPKYESVQCHRCLGSGALDYRIVKTVPTIKNFISMLADELKDKEYFYGWQSNIAMAFKDQMMRCPEKSIHDNANIAAAYFLRLLMMQGNKIDDPKTNE